jgi:hypothetical protein
LSDDLKEFNLPEVIINSRKWNAVGGEEKLDELIRGFVQRQLGSTDALRNIRFLEQISTAWVVLALSSDEVDPLENYLPEELQGIVKFQTASSLEEKMQWD